VNTLIMTIVLLFSSLGLSEINISIHNDVGTSHCDYQFDLDSAIDQTLNICGTTQDAKCLFNFNIDDTFYNLQEHYGLGSHAEGGLQLICDQTDEFRRAVLDLTVNIPGGDY